MKKIIVFLLIVFSFCTSLKAQTDSSKIDQYCLAKLQYKMQGNFEVTVDYGDSPEGDAYKLKDESGKNLSFISVVQFFNYMAKKKWRLISNEYGVGDRKGYLFRRKVYNANQ